MQHMRSLLSPVLTSVPVDVIISLAVPVHRSYSLVARVVYNELAARGERYW